MSNSEKHNKEQKLYRVKFLRLFLQLFFPIIFIIGHGILTFFFLPLILEAPSAALFLVIFLIIPFLFSYPSAQIAINFMRFSIGRTVRLSNDKISTDSPENYQNVN